MSLLRLGIIGAGSICNGAHIPAYVANRDVLRVAAIYDLDATRAEQTKEHYLSLMREAGVNDCPDILVADSADQLIDQVDFVDVCTSLKYHAHYASKALRKGVHAMSEKPMARTWPEAMEVVEAAKSTGALYQLNDDNIFLPRYQHFRNAVASGTIGDVTELWITRGSHSSDRAEWFYDPIEAGGGCILDYGSHAVTGSWFILGFDKEVEAVRSIRIGIRERTRLVASRLREIEVDDDAHFKVLYRNPANGDWSSVVIEATWAYPEFARFSSDSHGYVFIRGTEGTVSGFFDDAGQEYVRIERYAGGEFQFPIKTYASEDQSFREEIRNFCACIVSKKQPILGAETGAKTIRTINMAQLSEQLGRKTVTVEEFEAFASQQRCDTPLETGDAIAACLARPKQ